MKKESIKVEQLSIKEQLARFGIPNNLVDFIEKIGRIIDVEISGNFCYLYIEPILSQTIEELKYSNTTMTKEEIIDRFIEDLPREFSRNFKEDFLRNILLFPDSPISLIILRSNYKEIDPTNPNQFKEKTIYSVYGRLDLDVDENGQPIKPKLSKSKKQKF